MLTIGNIKLNNPFIQAPLAGYSDRAMRVLARRFGCELTFSGVILDTSASYKPLFKKKNYIIKDDEHPIGAQLLGAEAETMAAAAKNMRNVGYDVIDLNFACPARKVVKKARGGSLLDFPKTVLEIFKRVRGETTDCPVTMKLRIGIDNSDESKENFWEICEGAAGGGVDAITVHGRSVEQLFKKTADWEIIKQLKDKFPNTVIIGSGDLFDPVDCVNKLKASGADGLAIARGAIGKPWIFRQITDVLEGKEEIFQPDIKEQGRIILEHFEMLKELYETRKCIWYFRKFLAQYCKTLKNIKKTRVQLVAAQTEDELKQIIKQLYELD